MGSWLAASLLFLLTSLAILLRPGGVPEAVPAVLGGLTAWLAGLLDAADVLTVARIISNAALVIVATSLMASALESTGCLQWVAGRLVRRAMSSPHHLFHLILVLAVCFTWFFNNDGSILIGTPIVAGIVRALPFSRKLKIAYLMGYALLASASSAVTGISNMANLEAMAITGVSLAEHMAVLILPALTGMAVCWRLSYGYFAGLVPPSASLPPAIPVPASQSGPAPVPGRLTSGAMSHPLPSPSLLWFSLAVVIGVRAGLFAAEAAGLPLASSPLLGAALLLLVHSRAGGASPWSILRRAPWPLIAFAFGTDLVAYSLRRAGVTGAIASLLKPGLQEGALAASFLPAALTTVVSSAISNHSGLVLGALTLAAATETLSRATLVTGYGSLILAADLGALLTPAGTLASLLWLHLVRERGLACSWREYLAIAGRTVPLSLLMALLALYLQVSISPWPGAAAALARRTWAG